MSQQVATKIRFLFVIDLRLNLCNKIQHGET